jgi:NAD(P)-dependent dehydrogenase (short-subunit alcohol dehydrogenase family)
MAGRVSLRDNFMLPYNTNLAGTHVLTYTFMPLLLKSSDPRLLFISGLSGINQASESYYPTPPLPAGWPKEKNYFETIGYRCTKVALNMLMLDWNHKLKDDGVKVWGVQPGFLITGLGGENVDKEVVKKMGAGHPSEGGAMIKRVVEGEFDDRTGALVGKAGVGRY